MAAMRLRAALWLLAAAVGFSGTARAGFTVYGDLASFQSATADLSMSTIEFEGIAPERGIARLGAGGSLELAGVAFSTTSSAGLSVSDARYFLDRGLDLDDPYYNLGSNAFLMAEGGPPASINIALPEDVLAAGFLLGTSDSPLSGVTIELSTGETFVASAPYPSAAFVGIISSSPLSWINLTVSEGNFRSMLALDSFAFGSAPAQAIPEPGSLTLMALGGGALALLAWRRRVA